MVRRRGRLQEGLAAAEPVTRPMRGVLARGIGVTVARQHRSWRGRGRSRILVEAAPHLAGAGSLSCGAVDQGSLVGKAPGSRQKGRMRMKGAQVEGRWGVVGKEGRSHTTERWTTRRSYTPRKRRPARAHTLPDAEVAVSACGLAVWSFTLLYKFNK
jgi:hypothetical protein